MPNTIFPHPTNGTNFFGRVIEKTVRKILIPAGPIILKRGRYGSGGWGACHIWQRHQIEMRKAGFDTENDVARYVASIIIPGTPLYCEFARIQDTRLTVVRSATGTAVLQHQEDRSVGTCYSVVTAFDGRNPHGTRIGKVEALLPPETSLGPENEKPAKP